MKQRKAAQKVSPTALSVKKFLFSHIKAEIRGVKAWAAVVRCSAGTPGVWLVPPCCFNL